MARSKIEKRGRPQKNNVDNNFKDFLVAYLSTKPDDYNNNISYFKIIDSGLKIKLKPLFSLNADLKVPMWKTDDTSDYILKTKEKFITTLNDLILKETYLIDLDLVYYDMISKNIKGYYGMISKISKKG